MRTQGGYRFSLQFSADSEDQVRVGEFLERMGNRKSVMIVNAVSLYLDANPELASSGTEVKVQINAPMKKSEIENLIRSIIAEKLSEMPAPSDAGQTLPKIEETLEHDIASMLGNLSMFG